MATKRKWEERWADFGDNLLKQGVPPASVKGVLHTTYNLIDNLSGFGSGRMAESAWDQLCVVTKAKGWK